MSSWLSLVSIIVIIHGFTSAVISQHKPSKYNDHCNGLECPMYTVLNSNPKYELRHYPSFKWAAAVQSGLDYKTASYANFMKLFRYIQGANKQKVKIPMTAPVINHITITQGPFCASNFTMNFFVPYENQKNPPQPNKSEDKVFIVDMPAMTVYVGTFGGYSPIEDIQKASSKLATALQADGKSFIEDQLLFAGYDSPFKVFGRHNEVMLIKK